MLIEQIIEHQLRGPGPRRVASGGAFLFLPPPPPRFISCPPTVFLLESEHRPHN